MKVAKYYRVLSKHSTGDKKGKFNPQGPNKELIRDRVVVPQSFIDETNANTETSGIMYVVDEEATAARDAKQEGKTNDVSGTGNKPEKESPEKKAEREALELKKTTTNHKFASEENFDISKATVPEIKAFAELHKIKFSAEDLLKPKLIEEVTAWLDQPLQA